MQSSIISVLVTIITASVAVVTFCLTKKHEIDSDWRKRKIDHYKELLSSISALAVDGLDKDEANKKFAFASNTVGLVAPQKVVTALMNFHDYVKYTNLERSAEKDDLLLRQLMLAIRKDIGMKGDDSKTFSFHLVGAAPPAVSNDPAASRRAL
ncbi:MAG: hypothetical protein ACYC64_13375 [Armatimonadota bacterium]